MKDSQTHTHTHTHTHLQVPVDYVERVQVGHSFQHLSDYVGGIPLCVVPLIQNPVEYISSRGPKHTHIHKYFCYFNFDKAIIPLKHTPWPRDLRFSYHSNLIIQSPVSGVPELRGDPTRQFNMQLKCSTPISVIHFGR